MFQMLFGAEMPLAVRFFLAFLVVLGLIGAAAWAVRRFGTGRLGTPGTRGRQPRLAVIDYASVDARRRLILVRRDNVEHLLMIGGPTDVVVEANIVRALAAPRESAVPRMPTPAAPAPMETLPRAIPLPENGNGSWPLQPEPVSPRPAPRIEPLPEEPAGWPLQLHAEAPPRSQRDTLAALAEELAPRPLPPRHRPLGNARTQSIEPRGELRGEAHELRPEAHGEARVDLRVEPHREPHQEPRARMPGIQPAAEETAADQSLAEMAHRLEAALRKPNAPAAEAREARSAAMPPRAAPPPVDRAATSADRAPTPEPALPLRVARTVPPPSPPPPPPPVEDAAEPLPLPPLPRAVRPAEPPQQPRADARSAQGKTLYDSLEQEMASLLGRPTSKT